MKVMLGRPDNESVYALYRPAKTDRVMPPLSLMYLESYLLKAGHEVEIWDGRLGLGESFSDALRRFDPGVVGIGGTTPEANFSLEMFRMVKEYSKDIITVTGGPHFSSFAPEDFEDIDYIVHGDGEIALTYIADGNTPKTRAFEMLPDDIVYDAPMIRWNSMENWPYNFMFDARLEPTAAMLTSRGCPYKCTFCHNSKNFRKVRFRSIPNIIEEVKSVKAIGINHLVFLDETFSLKKERTIELCNELKEYDVKWKCLTRADRVDHDVVRAMADAGCVGISIGVESGNQEIIEATRKGVTKEQVMKAYTIINEYPQIEKRGSFILGHPYETRSTVEETIAFALKLPIDVAFFNIMTPYPSSEVYDQAVRGEGIHIVDEDWSHYKRAGVSTIRTDELSQDDLMELQKKALTALFTHPRVIKYHLKNLIKTEDQEYCTRPLLEVLDWELEALESVEEEE